VTRRQTSLTMPTRGRALGHECARAAGQRHLRFQDRGHRSDRRDAGVSRRLHPPIVGRPNVKDTTSGRRSCTTSSFAARRRRHSAASRDERRSVRPQRPARQRPSSLHGSRPIPPKFPSCIRPRMTRGLPGTATSKRTLKSPCGDAALVALFAPRSWWVGNATSFSSSPRAPPRRTSTMSERRENPSPSSRFTRAVDEALDQGADHPELKA
jgi:hypothetical protein